MSQKLRKVILLTPLIFLFLSSQAFATEDKIELNKNDTRFILNSVSGRIPGERIRLLTPENDIYTREEIVLALLDTGIKANSFQYLMTSAPKEVLVEIVKMGSKVAPLFYNPTFFSLIEFGAGEAKNPLTDWLVRNEVRVGGGKISIPKYTTVNGQTAKADFPFLVMYKPAQGDVEINIYSPTNLYPPSHIGNFSNYGIKASNFQIYDPSPIPPFILKVSGKLKEATYGGFFWTEEPHFSIDFNSPVPEMDIIEINAIERYFLKINKQVLAIRNALDAIRDSVSSLWNKIKSKLPFFGKASLTSTLYSSDKKEQTIVSLKDEISSIKKVLDKEPSSNKEIIELKKKIAELEAELEKGIPTEKTTSQQNRVEINTASKEDLTRIIHIGEARAQDIIRLRPFTSLDDLLRVPGIGAKILQDIKDQGIAYVVYEGEEEKKEEEREEEKKEEEKEKERGEEENPCDATGVDINRGSLKDLTYITGVGEVIAQRIIDYRASHTFYSVDDLVNVSGIGSATLEKIKAQGCAYVTTSSSPPADQTNKNEKQAKISVNANTLLFVWDEGEALPESQEIVISNTGEKELTWSLTKDDWITSDLSSGKTTKETKLSISVNPYGMEIGEYQGKITINSNDKTVVIEVNLKILPPPIVADNVVISEVQINEREFIELYNPTEDSISLEGWTLLYYSGDKDAPYRNWQFPKESVISSQSYFLIGVYDCLDDTFPETDWILGGPYSTGQLSNTNGAISLIDEQAEVVDLLGWGKALMRRGDPAQTPQKGMSLTRRKNSQDQYIDNQNNLTDFVESLPSPTNSKGETIISLIEDLRVECGIGSAQLYWTAPGVNQELYYNDSEAIYLTGTKDSYLVENLNYGTDYSFKIKVGKVESNIVSCKTEEIDYSTIWSLNVGNPHKIATRVPAPLIDEPEIELLLELNEGDYITSPLIVDYDNSFYFRGKISNQEGIFSFNNQGEKKWAYLGTHLANPLMLPDGSLLVPSKVSDQKTLLILLNRDGSVKWTEEIDGSHPSGRSALLEDKLYLLLRDKIVAFDLTERRILWEYPLMKYSEGLVIGENIFFSTEDYFYSLDFDGRLITERHFPYLSSNPLKRTYLTIPVIHEDLLYLLAREEKEDNGTFRDFLYLFNQSDITEEIWRREVPSESWGDPIINYDGEIFIFEYSAWAGTYSSCSSYNQDSEKSQGWTIGVMGTIKSSIIDSNNIIYLIVDHGNLLSYTPEGEELMREHLLVDTNGSLSISRDGTIFVSGKNYLYTIRQQSHE